MRIKIKKGLNIPMAGRPEPVIADAAPVTTVAALGTDVVGLRPSMKVSVGDRVRLGQTLFTDKRNPAVQFTAPGAGQIQAINRGARRALQSVVVRLDGDEAEEFPAYSESQITALGADEIRDNLLASGLWTAIRTRPFSRIPAPDSNPAAIFVTAIDTAPLAADPASIIAEDAAAFVAGLQVLARLADVPVHVCTAADAEIPCPDHERINQVEFAGPHPAGLVGTHIHFLDPVGEDKTVWHLRYHHVTAIGQLFTSGQLPTRRIVALGGPMVRRPRLLRTRVGASMEDILRGELVEGPVRVVSGSVLSGHGASGPLAWLGRYHNQVTVIAEASDREFMSWARPGIGKYSSLRAYAGHLLHRGRFSLTSTQNGSPRAMVPIGTFERVMPLDILATPLLKALLVEDTDKAKELGCLELDEEDLALCSFVCNGKYEYGPFLRMNLDEIEANG